MYDLTERPKFYYRPSSKRSMKEELNTCYDRLDSKRVLNIQRTLICMT